MIKPCMGGWCHYRAKCLHHTSPTNKHEPAERLCDKGLEREMFFMTKLDSKEMAEAEENL